MMDGLVVTLQGISNIAEIVNPFDPFLYKNKTTNIRLAGLNYLI